MAEYEKRWLKAWNERHLFESDPLKGKKKVFVTFPYPYMNGPVHIGHCFSATRVDVYARFKRMQGYNVLFPWSWHWTGETIAGMSYRLEQGDSQVRRAFIEIDGVPAEEVKKFTNPEYLASYYTKVSRRVVQATGFSIDWRREFTTVDPAYKRFIEWQYLRLRELGYVVQGTHPVVWCSLDQSPTGDHDRLEGEGVSPEEFNLLKFKLGDFALVAGTLRPETIFGATNLWVDPDAEYSEARVDEELWIVSSSALRRLAEQKHEVTPTRSFSGADLVGRYATAPLTGTSLPILPSGFVDAGLATGVVYSVPAHAPYDYMGLRDIQSGRAAVSRRVKEIADRIELISMIEVPGHSQYPAEDAVKKFGIKDSTDARLADATAEVYKEEFHRGVMKANTGFAGLKVSEAKERVSEALAKEGLLTKMHELPQRVVCRCGTRCYVKILENQWFLNYSNEEWKAKTKELLRRASVFPPESREWYNATIDWLRDWPCARRSGMGTKLPWDKEWIVETLSDSTIYMAFYTINKFVNAERAKPEHLSPEVLDFVILGRGAAANLAKAAKMSETLLREMRAEFLYWYPVDLRNSGKELIPNHLTFFAFHHEAMFGEKLWPRGFSVNGMIQIEGQRMSKSHGVFVTWKDALEKFGADAVRATVVLAGDGMEDTDWRAKNAEDTKAKVDSLVSFVEKNLNIAVRRAPDHLDRWLTSTMNRRIAMVTASMEEMRTRRAISAALLDVWNDLRWYLHRTEKPRRQTLTEVFSAWVRMLSPFIPFVSEELNRALGGKGLVCTADWPSPKDFPRDDAAELSELLVRRVLDDARNLLKIVKQPRQKLNVYVASDDARSYFVEVAKARARKESLGGAVKRFASLGITPERVVKLQYEAGDELVSMFVSQPDFDEYGLLSEASDFLARELGVRVEVTKAGPQGIHDPGKRAKDALPLKPAFYLE